VLGKGGKERAVDISPDLAAVLEALPHRRGPVIRRADGQAGHNTANNLSKLAGRYLRACGVPDTFHATRHRFGTEVCRVGGVRQAQEALGHASLSTTSTYTKVVRADLRPTVLAVGKVLTLTRTAEVEAGT
jgi:integrase/recombinase XerC